MSRDKGSKKSAKRRNRVRANTQLTMPAVELQLRGEVSQPRRRLAAALLEAASLHEPFGEWVNLRLAAAKAIGRYHLFAWIARDAGLPTIECAERRAERAYKTLRERGIEALCPSLKNSETAAILSRYASCCL